MNFSPHPGLRRIIVMQSSNIDYANLALAESTQLVGGNGRGKTTLINVLQFLYVPNETRWFFNGHLPPATKEHYFPRDKQPYARVIFEVMTPKGPAIVGVRRKTVASTDLEHFFATGAFERADFYDEDNRCKPWDKVKDALIVKGYKVIPDLQASLTGGGEINLGLVPMRKGDGRELFDVKFVIPFMRLFRLSAFDQKAMQRVLIDYARLTPEQSAFNPRATLERELEVALRQMEQIEQLQTAKDDVAKAENTIEQMTREGSWLAAAYGAIMRRRNDAVDEVRRATEPLQNRATDIQAALKSIGLKKSEATKTLESSRKTHDLAQADIELVEHDEHALAASNYVHDLAVLSRENLNQQIGNLNQRIGAATVRLVTEVEAELTVQSRRLENLRAERESFSSLLITHLRSELKDPEIAAAFSLLDAGLLRRIEGKDVVVADLPELATRLRGLVSRIDSRKDYSDDTVRVRLDSKNADKTLREIGSVEALDRTINEQIATVATATKALQEAREVENLRARIVAVQKELGPIEGQIAQYENLQKRLQQLPAKREGLARLKLSLEEAEAALKAVEAEENAKLEEKKLNDAELEAKTADLEKLKQLLINLPQNIALDDVGSPEEIPDTVSLLYLVTDYRTRHGTQQQIIQIWGSIHSALEARLGDRYTGAGATPAKRLQKLRTDLELAPRAREKAENELHALLAATASHFSQLRSGLHEVKRAADKINDAFRKLRLSNIEAVSCEVDDVHDAVREVDEIADLDPAQSLFGNASQTKDLIKRVRTRWETHPEYHVSDLYRVRLVIKNPGAKPASYDQFNERAGSNGQVIALKVLVNLLVLSIHLHPQRQARIPFYIDEIASLDPVNFRSIQQFAVEHGFVALYAAPEAKIGMGRYYPLRAKNGRLIVDDSCAQDARWH